ncbi:MAG: YggS family pyridoxal phosphate-dependent enzyme, partial [Polyangiales bacterium]
MIRENLAAIHQRIEAACARKGRAPSEVTLLAVSKLQPSSMIREAYEAGQRDFGENYAQELRDKRLELDRQPDLGALRWHFIGPLQRNKVHLVVGRVGLIHSVDSCELAAALAARAAKTPAVAGEPFGQDCL